MAEEEIIVVTGRTSPPSENTLPDDISNVNEITVDSTVAKPPGDTSSDPDIWLTLTYKNGDEPYEGCLSPEEYEEIRQRYRWLNLPELVPGRSSKVTYSPA